MTDYRVGPDNTQMIERSPLREEELLLEAKDLLERTFCPTQREGEAIYWNGMDIRKMPRSMLIMIIKIIGETNSVRRNEQPSHTINPRDALDKQHRR